MCYGSKYEKNIKIFMVWKLDRVKRYDEILDKTMKGAHKIILWVDGDKIVNNMLLYVIFWWTINYEF